MARIPDTDLQRLKEEISVQRLVEASGVELKKGGKDFTGRCPFHADDTASLVVTPHKNLWHCFGWPRAPGSNRARVRRSCWPACRCRWPASPATSCWRAAPTRARARPSTRCWLPRWRAGINGDTGRIVAVDAGRGVHLELEDGRAVWLGGSGPLQLDYGYCSTVHAAQGQTCELVMIEADAHSLTAGRNTFYVAISRARQTARIYTDDREMLPLAMGREMGKEAALELVADHEALAL